MFGPDIRCMMREKPSVDFESLATEKTVLFISSSPVNYSMHLLVNLFYSQAFKSLFEFAEERREYDYRLPRNVHILADDFATGSKIKGFSDYISVFRSAGISIEMLIQSESQLKSMYSEAEATTIINNCDTYAFLGCNDLVTAKNISDRMNLPLDKVLALQVGKVYIFRRGGNPVETSRYDILRNPEYQRVTREYETKIRNDRDR